MANSFNSALKRIRKEKGLTQEQLADAVGVSAQAVSKWEGQSYPDAGLLPSIADALDVTIDELFGREREQKKSMREQVVAHFKSLASKQGQDSENTIEEAYEICRSIILGLSGNDCYAPIPNPILNEKSYPVFSQMELEKCTIQARLNSSLQYFLLIPEPKGSFDALLSYDNNMARLFKFLGEPNVLRALYFLAGHTMMVFFRAESLVREIGVSVENARHILDGFHQFGIVREATLDGSKDEKIYQYIAQCTLPIMLTFVHVFLNRPNSFNYQTNSRSSPYFKHDTFKENSNEKEKGN